MPKLESLEAFGAESNVTVRANGGFGHRRMVIVHGVPLPINVVVTGIRKGFVLGLHVPAKMTLAVEVCSQVGGKSGSRDLGFGGSAESSSRFPSSLLSSSSSSEEL